MHLSRDLSRLRAALKRSGGNITRAARSLGVSKQYAMWLVRARGLTAWARGLRVRSGAPATGRPRLY